MAMNGPIADSAAPAPGAAPVDRARYVMRGVLRIGAGLLFMQHGAQKLLGWFGGMGGSGATADFLTQMWLAGVLELFGGLLIVLGLLTRPVAIILAVQMVWAYFQAHLPRSVVPIQNGGELALFYALTWAFFAAAGPGAASVDNLIRSRRTTPAS